VLYFAACTACVGCSSDRLRHRGEIDSAYFTFNAVPARPDAVPFPDPAALMREYARRDAAGERLATSSWFSDVAEWQDEPGWDAYTVIRSYDIAPATIMGDSASVRITYRRAGEMESGAQALEFVPDTGTESVLFALHRSDGSWKITAPQINQHVLIERVLKIKPLADSTRRLLLQLSHRG
jgi:hypothetical protein